MTAGRCCNGWNMQLEMVTAIDSSVILAKLRAFGG